MKLCFIANLNSIHVKKWIGYFCEKGHEITILSSGYFPEKRYMTAEVKNLLYTKEDAVRLILGSIGLRGFAKRLYSTGRNIGAFLQSDDKRYEALMKKAEVLEQELVRQRRVVLM